MKDFWFSDQIAIDPILVNYTPLLWEDDLLGGALRITSSAFSGEKYGFISRMQMEKSEADNFQEWVY
ncbi:MAG: hypothetical protein F6K65_34485, partial [Moorea sp. SIO3C2]|nr:hypothetical protein [Moorena sp. SIO3C2]